MLVCSWRSKPERIERSFFSEGKKCLSSFIGSPADGANGDVTNLVLPGGIYVNFSGHDVRHSDGRQLQRIGIQPQIAVEPTPRGIREGRDEVLEAAIKYFDAQLKK